MTVMPSRMWVLNISVNPGIDASSRRNATGIITRSTDTAFRIPAANMVMPWIWCFFCLTTIKPTMSMPKDSSWSIMLSSLLKGALVFSRLAMFEWMCGGIKRVPVKTD